MEANGNMSKTNDIYSPFFKDIYNVIHKIPIVENLHSLALIVSPKPRKYDLAG